MTLTMSIVAVFGLSVLFSWLAVHAWQSQRFLVKWPGSVSAGLLATLAGWIGVAALLGIYRVYAPGAAPAPVIEIAGTADQIDRGERLAYLCIACHSSSGGLPLDGGTENDMAGMGTLVPPNLTPGGPLPDWSDSEIVRAIRTGVHRSGRSLLLMPSDQYRVMSDADVQAVVAYLRSQPAVERPTPNLSLNILGAAVVGMGFFPRSVQPTVATEFKTPSGATPAHGDYLATIAGCAACHGEDLRGGTSPFTPQGPNLPAILAQWSADEFVETMRTGVDPYGNVLDPVAMPWPNFSAAFTDEELEAIYVYIRSLTVTPEATG